MKTWLAGVVISVSYPSHDRMTGRAGHLMHSLMYDNNIIIHIYHPLVTGLITGVTFHYVSVPIPCSDWDMCIID